MQGRVAQVVATLTRFDSVEKVAFRLDGEPVEAIGGEGVVVDPPIGRLEIEEQTPQILIESPLPGDSVTSPVRLRGTANVFEANVSIEVKDETGTVILEAFTTATSGTGTRGTFDTKLNLPDSLGDDHDRHVRGLRRGRSAASRARRPGHHRSLSAQAH